MPNALLVYPAIPPSYWSEKYALDFIGKKAAMPPLGLLTVAALFPSNYALKVVDMNVQPLTDEMLLWSNYVFCSAMVVQQESLKHVIERCNMLHIPIIAGGPYPTSFYEELPDIDHIVLGEVEDVFADFLKSLERGDAPHIYHSLCTGNGSMKRPSLQHTPAPRYDLIDPKNYAALSLQFSRGCPYNCEFCDITSLYGRIPRTKTTRQMLTELQLIYDRGWRGPLFCVDDNFIGNRANVMHLLPEMANWQKERNYPFSFFTEASVNLAEMPDLLEGMISAGFDMVFLGLETPNPKALLQANKGHNVMHSEKDYLLKAVRRIQNHGLEVLGGFILGLDGDDESAFDAQINFIQRAGIATAMVGLLTALKGTQLYERYKAEGRLISESNGNNMSAALNFIPTINSQVLLDGYRRVLSTLYDSTLRNYFARSYTLLKNWKRRSRCPRPFGKTEILAFLKTLWKQLLSRQGPAYLTFLVKVTLRRPRLFSEAVRLAVLGYHYEKVTRQQIMIDDFRSFLDAEWARLQESISAYSQLGCGHIRDVRCYLTDRLAIVEKEYERIHEDFRCLVDEARLSFQKSVYLLLARLPVPDTPEHR